MRTASMMVRKSRVEIVIYYRGGAEVLSPATSAGAVGLGGKGSGGVEDTRVVGNGAETKDVGT